MLVDVAPLPPVTEQNTETKDLIRFDSPPLVLEFPGRRWMHISDGVVQLDSSCELYARRVDAKAYYQRKRAEGKKHNAAVICVARRRCDLILAMLRTATPYDPSRHKDLPIAA